MELLFSKPSRPLVDKKTLLVEKEPYIPLKMRRRPELVEIVGRINVLENDDVPTRRKHVFDGIVRGADIRLYLEDVFYWVIEGAPTVVT